MTFKLAGGLPEGLPESVTSRIELPPPARFVIQALRDELGDDIHITPRIPFDALNPRVLNPPRIPMILVRKGYPNGYLRIDERFMGSAQIEVHVFTADPDGELKGFAISEAIRVILRDAWREKDTYYPGLGTLNRVRMVGEPTRKSDWANSTGPVQYADLPSGVWRTETRYRITYRKDTEEGA